MYIFQSKWAALCDSESSEDEIDKDLNDHDDKLQNKTSEEEQDDIIPPTQYKRKTKRKEVKTEPKKVNPFNKYDIIKMFKYLQTLF